MPSPKNDQSDGERYEINYLWVIVRGNRSGFFSCFVSGCFCWCSNRSFGTSLYRRTIDHFGACLL